MQKFSSGMATRSVCIDAPIFSLMFSASQKAYVVAGLRLSALMDLYIHPLYVLVSKILSSILNSLAPIHPLYHHLSTLYIVGPTCHFI
jgi:hypothetical protein